MRIDLIGVAALFLVMNVPDIIAQEVRDISQKRYSILDNSKKSSSIKIIFDTDFGTSDGDIDDLGALAVLHTFANNQECEILAVMLDHNHNKEAMAGVDAVNTFYDHGNIPVAHLDGQLSSGKYNFSDYLADTFTNDVNLDSSINATALYRKLLSEQPDTSIRIVVTGKLRNIKNLLLSGGDSISSLSGSELIGKKVRTMYVMGGRYPASIERAESNFYNAGDCVAKEAVLNFPRPIVFNGFEVGCMDFEYATGKGLNDLPDANPIKMGYLYWFQNPPDWAASSKSDTIIDWSIWDQISVHTAVRGVGSWFDKETIGYNEIACDGSNIWRTVSDKEHVFLKKKMNPKVFSENIIEPLMKTKSLSLE